MNCEVLIVGGGLVGASLACALSGQGRSVVLAEATAASVAVCPSFDERNLALGEASLNALATLGILAHLRTPPAPIARIHVSCEGDLGAVRLDARDYGREALGGVVIARELGQALEARLAEMPALGRLRPARLVALEPRAESLRAVIAAPDAATCMVDAKLVVAADGTESTLRGLANIAASRHDYRQTLFSCAVTSDRPQGQVRQAWERFSAAGPVALLPRADRCYGSVCGVATDVAGGIAALTDAAYRDYLQQRFGGRAGRFLKVGTRAAYPLHSVVAERLVGERLVLVGNAAQTLHPIGAQGFNLGLRDALCLVELLDEDGDAGAAQRLAGYPALRNEDRTATQAFSDGLARFTAAPGFFARGLRSLGLIALDSMPELRAGLVGGAMGYRGRIPRLARAPGGNAIGPAAALDLGSGRHGIS